MGKPFLTEYRGELSFLVFILSVVALVISVFGLFFRGSTPEALRGLVEGLVAWYIWLFLGGAVFIIAGGYYFFTTVRGMVEFKRLLRVETKTQFMKNLPELERLAFDLPERYDDELRKMKKEFGLKG